MATLEMEFGKMTKHQRMLFKPKANQQWLKPKQRKCGRERCKETMGIQRIKQSKTRHKHKNINTHTHTLMYSTHTYTHHDATKKVHNHQNPCPNRRQGGRAAHDKTPLADCLLLSPPSSRGTHH